MPTPNSHGGAVLEKVSLNTPAGFRGLNTQFDGSLLPFEWATTLKNTVLDGGSRVTSRKGWIRRSTDASGPGSARITRLFEYEIHGGAVEQVCVDITGVIWGSVDDGATWTDITGTASVTDPFMQFVNFREDGVDKLFGFQDGGTVIVYETATPFIDFVPTVGAIDPGHDVLDAFGRLWVADTSGEFIHYCALEALGGVNDWDFADPESDSGAFDHRHIWQGVDTIQAVIEFNGSLVVFGSNNIIIWSDGSGSALGLDPLNMYVVDTIDGVGCFARDSVVEVDGDVWFLSSSGIQSLKRVIQQRSNPMENLSLNVHDKLMERARNTERRDIEALYSPEERFVLYAFPDATQGDETGQAFCFDSRNLMDDGTARCIGIWDTLVPKAMIRMAESNNILMFLGVASQASIQRAFTENVAGIYAGHSDPRSSSGDPLVPYSMVYESGWNSFESPYIKIPKKVRIITFTTGETAASFNISYDFNQFAERQNTYTVDLLTDKGPAFFTDPRDISGNFDVVTPDGVEWSDEPGGVDAQSAQAGEWTGAFKPVISSIPAVGGAGEFIRIGFQARIAGFPVSLQEISIYIKQGRII